MTNGGLRATKLEKGKIENISKSSMYGKDMFADSKKTQVHWKLSTVPTVTAQSTVAKNVLR